MITRRQLLGSLAAAAAAPPRPRPNILLLLADNWAQHASAHELASIAGDTFDHLSEILPPHVSDQFVGGFREAVQRVCRGT